MLKFQQKIVRQKKTILNCLNYFSTPKRQHFDYNAPGLFITNFFRHYTKTVAPSLQRAWYLHESKTYHQYERERAEIKKKAGASSNIFGCIIVKYLHTSLCPPSNALHTLTMFLLPCPWAPRLIKMLGALLLRYTEIKSFRRLCCRTSRLFSRFFAGHSFSPRSLT